MYQINYTSFFKRSLCKWNRIRYWTDQEVNKVGGLFLTEKIVKKIKHNNKLILEKILFSV